MTAGLKVHIAIGSRTVLRAPHVWIDSHRFWPLTRMGIVLPDPDRALFRSILAGEPVWMELGYRNREMARWEGTVTHLSPGRTPDQIMVCAAGPELPLAQTRIVQAFENESAESIVRWALGRAGLSLGRIDTPGPVIPRFSAGNLTVWELARSVELTIHRGFGIDMNAWALWVDAAGAAQWGDFDAPGRVPVIRTGEGLIRHTPAQGPAARHTLETFLVPGLRHSQLFGLEDRFRGVSGTFRALSVRHELGGHRARTFISWGDVYEKF